MHLRLVANVRTVEIRLTVGERLRTFSFIERRAVSVIPLLIIILQSISGKSHQKFNFFSFLMIRLTDCEKGFQNIFVSLYLEIQDQLNLKAIVNNN